MGQRNFREALDLANESLVEVQLGGERCVVAVWHVMASRTSAGFDRIVSKHEGLAKLAEAINALLPATDAP